MTTIRFVLLIIPSTGRPLLVPLDLIAPDPRPSPAARGRVIDIDPATCRDRVSSPP